MPSSIELAILLGRHGPLPVGSRVINPLIGVITSVTHLEGHS